MLEGYYYYLPAFLIFGPAICQKQRPQLRAYDYLGSFLGESLCAIVKEARIPSCAYDDEPLLGSEIRHHLYGVLEIIYHNGLLRETIAGLPNVQGSEN